MPVTKDKFVTFCNLSQAEAKAKERLKEQAKKLKILAQDLIILFKGLDITYQTKWEEIRPKVENTEAFLAIESESDRKKVFDVSLYNIHLKYISAECELELIMSGIFRNTSMS
jgi:hypothetical protein